MNKRFKFGSLLNIFILIFFSFILFAFFAYNFSKNYSKAQTLIIYILCGTSLIYGYKSFLEEKKNREIKKLIAKYVSPDIAEGITSDPKSVKLGGKNADVSILFADIRNFTSISDTLEPEEVAKVLNEYFSEMIPIIFSYDGTVNKFIGDALLVIFTATAADSEHHKKAVKCAVEMVKKVNELKESRQNEIYPLINIGIGISSGIAFLGNIGAENRHEYSAIGNTVNTASRLESFNKLYKTNILICEHTYERVKDITEAKEIDSVSITQHSEPIKIYEITPE